jgi:hypothetical protein
MDGSIICERELSKRLNGCDAQESSVIEEIQTCEMLMFCSFGELFLHWPWCQGMWESLLALTLHFYFVKTPFL